MIFVIWPYGQIRPFGSLVWSTKFARPVFIYSAVRFQPYGLVSLRPVSRTLQKFIMKWGPLNCRYPVHEGNWGCWIPSCCFCSFMSTLKLLLSLDLLNEWMNRLFLLKHKTFIMKNNLLVHNSVPIIIMNTRTLIYRVKIIWI